MQGVIKKFFYSVLALFLALNTALAIDNEYKNSLTKIELSKKDDNSYNIDLFTQKKYSEPVKVIKKSDLSYYILLPETKNSSVSVSGVADVKNVSTNSYFYAGQNKNGYTKININTTKPVNFNVNVKSLSSAKTQQKQTLKQPQQLAVAQNKVQEETSSIQKKNSTSSPSLKKPIETKKVVENKAKVTAPVKKEVKKQINNQIKQVTATKNKVQKIVKTSSSEAKNQQAVNNSTSKTLLKEDFETIDKEVQNEVEKEFQKEKQEEQALSETVDETANKENIENVEENSIDTSFQENQAEVLLHKIYNKILPYKNLVKLLLLSIFIILSLSLFVLLIVLIIPFNKNRNKRKPDKLIPFSMNERKKDKPKKEENNGQYFILNNNIAKNNFENSSRNRKHYELSSYEPDIQLNYNKNKRHQDDISKAENDYDIIRKILKEDSLIDYTPDEISKVNKVKQVQDAAVKQCEELKVKKEVQASKVVEPTVLSSVEIAPERGFMCVGYNDNINLIGYIFDDVFALYNFKCPKLENYDIKYRLTDKDDKGANFIVKVENYKMVVRVTKSFMTLEVLM